MTREEAIKRLKEIDISDALQEDYDALYMAIEALEKEPCEDDKPCTECPKYDKEKHYCPHFCHVIRDVFEEKESCEDAVSRQAVMDCFKKWQPYMATRLWWFEQELSKLPSVTPQEPKTGHWIWDDKSNVYRCSYCNQFPWRINTEENDEVFIDMKRTNAYKFCPNCGADMRGDAESEE